MPGIFSNLGRRARYPAGKSELPELPKGTEAALRAALKEERRVKDGLAALAQTWRKRGVEGDRYARELEATMGWEQPGDPLTGCMPVTPQQPGQP